MMKNIAFTEYVKSVGGDDAAAEILGISSHTVAAYRRGVRAVSLDIAKNIEDLSEKAFSRLDLLYPAEYGEDAA